jgi:feruloyl esterase
MKGRIPPGDRIWNASSPLQNDMIFLIGNGGNNDPTGAKLNDPEAFRDYAWRSLGPVFDFGQAVAKRYYSSAPAKNYFFGCSGGGAEALQAAMVYPENYDGIVAQASPPDRVTYIARTAPLNVLPPVSEAAWDLIQNAFIAECDALDGLKDGIVAHQGACRFDPTQVAGLAPAEKKTIEFWFSDIKNKDGTVLSRKMAFGPVGYEILSHHADIWARTLFASDEPNYNAAAFDFERYRPKIEFAVQRFGFTPDPIAIAGYLKSGGKLMLQIGTEDATFSVYDLAAFSDTVRAQAGAKGDSIQMRLLPGVGHCGNYVVGTNRTQEQTHLNGADTVEMLGFMRSWVATGSAPGSTLVATRRKPDGSVQLSRPVCSVGSYPRYNGRGDASKAESFTCVDAPGVM